MISHLVDPTGASDLPSPVILMDFDGPINFFSSRSKYRKRGDVHGYLKRVSVNVDRGWFDINWSAELVKKLMDAKKSTGSTWLWHSSWNDYAHILNHHLGIDSDGVVDWDAWTDVNLRASDDVINDIRHARKYAAVVKLIHDNPRPFVWVDDTATVLFNPNDFADLNVPYLIVDPKEDVGITKFELNKITSFLTTYAK